MRQLQGLPELIVTLGRRRLSAADTAAIVSVQVLSSLARPAQCLITWRPGPGQGQGSRGQGNRGIDPAPGDALRVELGGRRTPLFVGEVTVVERSYGADLSQEIRVRAYDALHRLRKRQFTRLHGGEQGDVDLAGLARTLCEGTGLQVTGGSAKLGQVYQCARSDLALLVEQSARVGMYPVVDGDALRLTTLAGEGDPVELELGSSLHSAEVELSQEPAYLGARTAGWHSGDAEALEGSASGSDAKAGVSADPALASVGAGGELLRGNEAFASGAAADGLAQAELDVRMAGQVSAVFVADGDPLLRAGGRVRVRGLASSLEGTYAIASAVHRLDGSGYETTVTTRPPETPPPRQPDVFTLGVVADVNDPEERGRVRVRLPAYPPLESGWAPVLSGAAGPGKGLVLPPAPEDTVLVLLPATDPAQAIVLGGLYGRERTPDAGGNTARESRYTFRSADGQQIVLDGGARTVSFTDGHGSTVELGPDKLRITAATDLLLEAPGKAMRIRAKTVDFEEA
ncbi:phage baseplate assembly protein V [Arthrobacter cupressi]|uniref:Type VI secretion system, phage-baseplate injector n=1 Tax=Arthrobacter cupressi TaxID=1045773 RepID=A0A1G8LT20_9MICC|nr:phage baseplate assembly protein V [Arthrobacter cupressi]NYD77524.1 phage baseplate assembly protein gpV [Arthrobacter cupressi]SDI58849.1 Type VI secretion system, phage-baseplate injector [Arthrobacter cupressi]